jgi:hypothetical protein
LVVSLKKSAGRRNNRAGRHSHDPNAADSAAFNQTHQTKHTLLIMSTKHILAAAAITGILSGSAFAASNMASKAAPGVSIDKMADKGQHTCKGHNECKGQGGCKSGDNGCKGKNSCKGKGGCSTMPKKPAK